ncbi:hypothetical protein BN946_scf184606.g8 [Trametes cinnabarina]|uniref:Fungal-type protein kinase domain-containing protein n=1 Tax=Pycnoporus cinnabarinus TaxID=5643 RepID=A0A060SRW1_PYCCI|nr:hypothetical protein BN946_scf184606.g8 [Trametes cinnabarina]
MAGEDLPNDAKAKLLKEPFEVKCDGTECHMDLGLFQYTGLNRILKTLGNNHFQFWVAGDNSEHTEDEDGVNDNGKNKQRPDLALYPTMGLVMKAIALNPHKGQKLNPNVNTYFVSEPFNYVNDPLLLATFIYRYILATPECHIDPKESEREFLVGQPAYKSPLIIGHATQGSLAWDMWGEHIMYIKDSWREDVPNLLAEYDIYRELSQGAERRRYIPTLLWGGDIPASLADNGTVPYQGTLSDTIGVECGPPGRIHTQLVLKEVCHPLQSFKDWRELVSVVHDALRAHKMACEGHGILHRDISVRNILIYDGDRASPPIGLLSDWDLAKMQEQIFNPCPSQPSCSGTWQFMSAALQMYMSKPHLLPDDLESIMHIINWLALRYMNTMEIHDMVKFHLRMCYDAVIAGHLGSLYKREKVIQGSSIFEVPSKDKNHPFVILTQRLSELCKSQYSMLNPAENMPEALIADCYMAWQQSHTDGRNDLKAVGPSGTQEDITPQAGH